MSTITISQAPTRTGAHAVVLAHLFLSICRFIGWSAVAIVMYASMIWLALTVFYYVAYLALLFNLVFLS